MDWTPRPPNLNQTLAWWGCCEETGRSPIIHAAPEEHPVGEWVYCPHCEANVTEFYEDATRWEPP